jgi:hypothetical protein
MVFSGLPKVHHIIILIVCVVVLTASFLFEANDTELYLFGFKWPMQCFLHRTFDIKCSLCGLTRSFNSLAHGNLQRAAGFHILGPAMFAFICLQIPYRIYALKIHPGKMNGKLIKINTTLTIMLLAAIFINWLIYLGGLVL